MKEKYLNDIKNGLSILSEEEVNKTINTINTMITEELNGGKDIETVINNLPSKEEIINKTLKEHGINLSQMPSKTNKLPKIFKDLIAVINNLIEVMKNNNFQSNLKIIFDIIVLFVFAALIKIPFIFIRNLGDNLLETLKFPIALNIWGIAIEFVYLIIAIMVFMNIFSKWFKNLKPSNEIKEEPKTIVKEEPIKMGEELKTITLNDNNNENI